MNVSIGEAALVVGVSVSTLREWDRKGKFKPAFRTSGGHGRCCDCCCLEGCRKSS